jgi:hypothetical protein
MVAPRWLLLIHQIPPVPAYFRAKVGRRLQRLGAVPIKNAVYVLPSTEQTREDFQWLSREIAQEGGEATLCSASLVDGLDDGEVEALFQAAREADYRELAIEARELARVKVAKAKTAERDAELARRKKRLGEIVAIDFFGAPGREAAEASLAALEHRLAASAPRAGGGARKSSSPKIADYQRRVWVTRKNVHVDRIACAWLIRRFIDPKARFQLVPGQGYVAKRNEVTFDMFEADFTHVGDRCSFETLVERFALRDPGLGALAEIVHDIDVKDGKFGRAEAPGVAALVAGIAVSQADDAARIELGGRMFDALLELYRRKRP